MFLFVDKSTLNSVLIFAYHLDIICPGCNLKNDARSVRHVGWRGKKETQLHLMRNDDDAVSVNVDVRPSHCTPALLKA